ncbi:SIS domain-containing protein [Microlunatus elymi]|uniref:SIS domain-containing protein n=1 Tax=Microlunatus elymi TaxID=2596828 RepID=A0A516Q4Y5_9ACTN|nr:SIS domain-containing protein [Microlunatus elymi]QDP98435.1 SIS domain-containing protein [Microlunatus elymi]
MSAEIGEQPAALEATLAGLLPMRPRIAQLAGGRKRVLLVARGSSDNAAIYGRYLAELHAGISASLAAPSVATLYDARVDLSDTLAICVSQSGSTTEIVETLEWTRRCGAITIAITNVEDSPLASAADLALITRAGIERAVPATKSYTTQVAALAVAMDALATSAGKKGLLDKEFSQIGDHARAMLATPAETLDAMAGALAEVDEVLTSGRGIAFGTTLETALKLEETCLRPVRGLSYADLKHGPIAIVDHELLTVLVAGPSGPTVPGLTELAGTVREKHSMVLGIGGDEEFRSACDLAVPGPDASEILAPLTLIIPAQLIVERLAHKLGLNPDVPRGLRKVTQTD